MVLKHAPWILEKMAEPSRAPMPLSLVTGETLPYLGSDFPLVVEPGQGPSPQVTFKQDAFHISVPPDLDDDEREKSVLKALAAWYRARAEEYIPGEVDLWWPRLGVKKRSRVIIGSQRSLWGSCAADGTLRFSWRAMMLSPDLIEYIIVHELAHLKIKDHSSRFWKFMARVLPDVRDRRIILRETSRRLPL